MGIDQDPQIEKKPEYWNAEFERKYGDLLTKAILVKFPGLVIDAVDTKKDVFYYMLKVLQSLVDSSIKVGSPSKALFFAFSNDVLVADEYFTFEDIAGFIRMNDRTADQILTETLLLKCDEIIEKPSLAAFYFKFTAPKKEIQ